MFYFVLILCRSIVSKEKCKETIEKYAIKEKVNIHFQISEKKKIAAICGQENCKWRLYASINSQMKRAYTNKKTCQIDDGLVREVVSLVQTQVQDEVSQLQTEDDDSTASTNLSRFRINEIVESVSSFFLSLINLFLDFYFIIFLYYLNLDILYFSRFQRRRDVWSVWVVAPSRFLLLLHHRPLLIHKYLRLS